MSRLDFISPRYYIKNIRLLSRTFVILVYIIDSIIDFKSIESSQLRKRRWAIAVINMEHVIDGNLSFTIVKLKKLLSKKDIVKIIICDPLKCVKDASLVTKPTFQFHRDCRQNVFYFQASG